MKSPAALALFISLAAAETTHAPLRVTAVRHWKSGEVTRVAIEVSGTFKFRSDRLQNPDRIYFDILNSRPSIGSKRVYSEAVDDALLKRVRVAETVPGITRVVMELGDNVAAAPSELINPNRLIVELHAGAAPPPPPPVISAAPQPKLPVLPPPAEPNPPVEPKPSVTAESKPPVGLKSTVAADPIVPVVADAREVAKVEAKPAEVVPPILASSASPPVVPPATHATTPAIATPAHASEVPKSARLNSTGEASLVRALGLKINRVVIDAGHGGHDEGTMGPKGLLEKDLVLDVATRLGKLIEQRLGAEVVFTRTDDTFIPLERRTEIANEKKADLFLSIHANSSPAAPRVTGIETYYLNFTQSKDALEVAARENAGSQNSVFDLRDLIQKITLHDKAEESREFAERVQASLYALSARNFPGEKNRGVRKAPFVVLIGANMPSILAEIGFLTNPREETLLRRSDYKQKVAEALYRGISHYADSLSHFQVAKN
ncbi:MAG TPA: N-acetylmuramoyl-L-alanine amidase [Bryobacteraceae bacterium]|jgi:N-acetylmuramoyl-L-alanine amidase